jgi:hypothetical protein
MKPNARGLTGLRYVVGGAVGASLAFILGFAFFVFRALAAFMWGARK